MIQVLFNRLEPSMITVRLFYYSLPISYELIDLIEGSVMHYGPYGFAIDPSIPTIIVPDGVSIGQRAGFSDVCHLLSF